MENEEKEISYVNIIKHPYHVMILKNVNKVGFSLNEVIRIVCEMYGADPYDIKGPIRRRELVDVRHICCFIAFNYNLRNTKVAIGRALNRDHSTVIHAINSVKNLYHTNEDYAFELVQVMKEFNIPLNRLDFQNESSRKSSL
jgi:chromosomal replication initiation ATPase DnaA